MYPPNKVKPEHNMVIIKASAYLAFTLYGRYGRVPTKRGKRHKKGMGPGNRKALLKFTSWFMAGLKMEVSTSLPTQKFGSSGKKFN